MVYDELPVPSLVLVGSDIYKIFWGVKEDFTYQSRSFRCDDIITKEILQNIIDNTDYTIEEINSIAVSANLTEADSVLFLKEMLSRLVKEYDSTSEVNCFYLNGDPIWLDKNTRIGLKLRLQSEREMGIPETTLWSEDIKCYSMSIYNAEQLLNSLEVYASKCFDTTKRHLSNISQLKTIEELLGYDYKLGYPEKLNIKLKEN